MNISDIDRVCVSYDLKLSTDTHSWSEELATSSTSNTRELVDRMCSSRGCPLVPMESQLLDTSKKNFILGHWLRYSRVRALLLVILLVESMTPAN